MKKLPIYPCRDATEQQLFDQLRATPGDDPTRAAYADWLEQQGDADRAHIMRSEQDMDDSMGFGYGDLAWRVVISRAVVTGCVLNFGVRCTKRWDAMECTDRDDVRHCGGCQKPVYYCTSMNEVRARGRRNECIAIDAGLMTSVALHSHDYSRPLSGEAPVGEWVDVEEDPPPTPSVPPPIVTVAEPPSGVFGRIGRWFRRER